MAQTATLPKQDQVERIPRGVARWPVVGVVLAFVAAFTCGVFLLLGISLPHPVPASVINLLGQDSPARMSVSAPPGAEVAGFVHQQGVDIGGDIRPSLFMHPPASASFWLEVPANTHVEFSIGLDPAVWDKPGDGVEFQVRARAWNASARSEEERTLFSRYIDPRTDVTARRWTDATVDLGPFGGQYVLLTLQTLPHASPEYDWALWSNLRITR